MSEYKDIQLSFIDTVAVIKFLKSKKYVILSTSLIKELVQCLTELDKNNNAKVIIITGDELSFAVGADVTEMANKNALDMHLSERARLWHEVRKIEKPIISAVSGYCFGGGCELILMTDIIIASDTASFSQPEINLGFIPGAGGTFRWPKLVGKYIASEIIMTGRNISVQEAKEFGLVNKIVSKDKLMEESLNIAKTIASKSPFAIKFAKKLIQRAIDFPTEVCLELERQYFDLLFDTEETKQLINNFLNR